MKPIAAVLAVGSLATGAAWAEEKPPAAKDAVEIHLAAKVGDVIRFRETESSSMEIGGKANSASELTQDYSVTINAARPDGGYDVEVTFEKIHRKWLKRGTDVWNELDTSKPDPADADAQTVALSTVARAMVGHAFKVTLDAHGAPTAVSGVREVVKAGIKGTAFEAALPVDEIFADADCMKIAASLFASEPTGPHAVGSKWTESVKATVNSQPLDLEAEDTLAAATPDEEVVKAKYTWKPGREASVGGAKPAGGGESTAKFSRKDGFVLSMTRHLEANRETSTMKATSHTDMAIERLPALAAAKPPDTGTGK